VTPSARLDWVVTCAAWVASAIIMFAAVYFAGKGVAWLLS